MKPLLIFWIIFLLDLELQFIDKLQVFRWELTVPLFLQVCFCFCYESDFMTSLSRENQADIIGAFKFTSRLFDDLLNIDNIYFQHMVDRIYLAELTEAPFFWI